MAAPKLTRKDVKALLHMSKSGVRVLEMRGELNPKTDANGVHVFDRREVEAVAARRAKEGLDRGRVHNTRAQSRVHPLVDGETQARCFELLQQNASHQDVVIKLRLPIEVVRELYREYRTNWADGERQRVADKERAQSEKEQREHDRRVAAEERRAHQLKLAKIAAAREHGEKQSA